MLWSTTLKHIKQLFRLSPGSPQLMGRRAENYACNYLKRLGYDIVNRNWRSPWGEIDIICTDRFALVFVEVRARASEALVSGYASITRAKKKKILRTAQAYMRRLSYKPITFRFDVAEICYYTASKTMKLNHFKNVALFPANP